MMTPTSRSRCGRALKRILLVSAAMPLVACSSIPMPQFVDDAFPGMFAPEMVDEPIIAALEQEEQAQMILADLNKTDEIMVAEAEDVEQPDVFQSTDMAMWDGRPTLGDIWVSVPGATQPERVVIRNEQTGRTVKGAMFVRDTSESNVSAPIKLSPGAARALGVGPLELAKISVTALRKEPQPDESVPMIARTENGVTAPRLAGPRLKDQDMPLTPMVSFEDPYLEPTDNEDGYVEVAQAIDPDGAWRVQDQLEAAAIPSEIQEDFVDGRSVYRVFASAHVDHDTLGGTLHSIRFTGAEGSDDGTLIAEMPNFDVNAPVKLDAPAWVSVGMYSSRNEAMAVIQKMARKSIPGEICSGTRGDQTVYKVFGGPAFDTDADLSDEEISAAHQIENKSFCIGVAAAEISTPPIRNAIPARAPLNDERAPEVPAMTDGAVRIRVGEATGGLSLRIPNPYSAPVQIPVAGIMMSLPMHTPPELVAKIRTHLELLETDAPDTSGSP